MKRWSACLAGALLAFAAAASGQQPETIRWEPYEAKIGEETVAGAQLGRLRVPENHSRATGRTIDLAFVRLPGRRAGGVPLIYLDGGPGGSGVGVLSIPQWARLLDQLRNTGDVILLSQRGTGLTQPRPVCGPVGEFAADAFLSRTAMLAAAQPNFDACLERWREEIDLASYNTQESAHDVDALRRALGVPQVNLLGFSYGTHLGLEVLRSHGAGIAHAVLAGTEGPDETYKFPSTFDVHLRNISYLVAQDSSTADDFPDLYGAVQSLLARLERQPLTVTLESGRAITIGADGLRYILRRDIGDTNDLPLLPALLQDIDAEGAPFFTMLAERRYKAIARGMALMPIAMDCASGASATRMQRIRAEWSGTTFGAMTEFDMPDSCERLGVPMLDASFRTPVHSPVPTLFVSGTLDAHTPPYQAEQARWGFPNSAHLIVENAGHESTLPVPAVQDAIVRFLLTGELVSEVVRLPKVDFLDREEALRMLGR